MTLPEAQIIAESFCNNPKTCNVTIADIRSALVLLGNFYEDYKGFLTKDDFDHPDYYDPYLRDGENQNYQ